MATTIDRELIAIDIQKLPPILFPQASYVSGVI